MWRGGGGGGRRRGGGGGVGVGGLVKVGVGVDQGVGGGVLGEEGQHVSGARGAAGHVVSFQGHVLAPVHDGVEVQIEVPAGVGDEVGGQHRAAERGQQCLLAGVVGAGGGGGERGGFGERGQPGGKGGGGGGG